MHLVTDYTKIPWLEPADDEINHCERCQTLVRASRIAWLEQSSDQKWQLPGGVDPNDSLGCFAFCATCARLALRLTGRGKGRPKGKIKPLQVQLWLSGARADKIRARAKASGDTPQEVIRRMIDRA